MAAGFRLLTGWTKHYTEKSVSLRNITDTDKILITLYTEEIILNGLSSPMDTVAWIINLLLISILLAGFVALCLWFYRRFTRSDSATRQTPIEIARERYAKGEINKEQFEQIRKDLA